MGGTGSGAAPTDRKTQNLREGRGVNEEKALVVLLVIIKKLFVITMN